MRPFAQLNGEISIALVAVGDWAHDELFACSTPRRWSGDRIGC
jgi:hypothetical protein